MTEEKLTAVEYIERKEQARREIVLKLQEAIEAVEEFNRLWDEAIEVYVKPQYVRHR